MLVSAIRFVQRSAVLVPGLIIAYLSIFNIFPWLNNHLPVAFAVIATYVLAAYILVPAFTRLVHIVVPPKHAPVYCVTADGFASDPINVGIIGTREEVLSAMRTAGWFEADKLTIRNALHLALSTIYGWEYPTGPMSNLFLFGRRQDLSFQIPIAGGAAGSRHHVRFWAATYLGDEISDFRAIDWQNRQAHVRNDRLLWVGAASRDVGVTFIRHNAQLTHLVDPDTDSERDLIVRQLTSNKTATLHNSITLGKPYKLRNIRGWVRRYLHTDGQMTILEITPQTANSSRAS